MSDRPRLLYLITEDWYFRLHWIRLAQAARDAGFEVLLAMRVQEHDPEISRQGFKLFPINLLRRSVNPMREFLAVVELARLYRAQKPDLVYHVAIKPILYGSIAARLADVPSVINVFAGLGYAYTSDELRAKLLRLFLKFGLSAACKSAGSLAVFQNEEDQAQLVRDHVVLESQTRVIPGTGVDTDRFRPISNESSDHIILLPCRMLRDKGVGEFLEAARLVRRQKPGVRFVLAGRCDEDNPASIQSRQLHQWQEEGVIEWWGHRSDMPDVLGHATVVVLPSYREGLPVSLLEAAACGKPIIATDVPGCREVVRHRVNGLLIPPRNAIALADAIILLLENPELRQELGRRGRDIVVKEFSSTIVIRQTLALYHELLQKSRA
ncbi:MAG: glycosyltransferase family 4 protein [Nitrospira sp. CG24B]|nr:MAG: glycosyltransferase family 4 protein [Nitrospira sp. CG24B]